MGAIVISSPIKNQFLSPYFLVDKPDKTKRFIFNLQSLNKFIKVPHFKIEDLRTACKLVDKNYFMCHLDLKDGFFHIPIHTEHRKFLRFLFEGVIYEFVCLPFGLNISPYIFTKTLKPVVNYLRDKGFLSVVYLDDFLLLGDNYNNCLINVHTTIKFLESIGFSINYKKSHITPSKICPFLGFLINSNNLTVELPSEKRKTLLSQLNKFCSKTTCTIREFAQILGRLVASCPAIAYGMVHTKSLERTKFLELILTNGDFDKRMNIPDSSIREIHWWMDRS